MTILQKLLDYLAAWYRSSRAYLNKLKPGPRTASSSHPRGWWRHEQTGRLAILFGILVVGALVARAYFVPTRFKDVELHRNATIDREVQRPVRFAGAVACAECHDDQTVQKRRGHHRNLACETCHGPSYEHTQDPSSSTPYAPRTRELCPQCHAYDASRPTGFPQINPAAHNGTRACIECHNPHVPEPPETPECGACHGEIEKTKSLSPHASLSCSTCHDVQEQHKSDPRRVSASKPETREFCGKCHDRAASDKAPPKVDIAKHGEKYLCWECHYPHQPEVE